MKIKFNTHPIPTKAKSFAELKNGDIFFDYYYPDTSDPCVFIKLPEDDNPAPNAMHLESMYFTDFKSDDIVDVPVDCVLEIK